MSDVVNKRNLEAREAMDELNFIATIPNALVPRDAMCSYLQTQIARFQMLGQFGMVKALGALLDRAVEDTQPIPDDSEEGGTK